MSGSGSEQPPIVRPGQPPAAPPPPAGPGVQPPFVAPPTDGVKQRRWMAIGLSAGAAVLLCAAGGAGFGGLIYFGARALSEQAQGTVVDYLSALRDEEYGRAYGLLCDDLQANMSVDQFTRTSSEGPRIAEFEVGQASLVTDPVQVPATIDYVGGDVRTVRFFLEQDTGTGAFEVCGESD